jgi:hypothetical protein
MNHSGAEKVTSGSERVERYHPSAASEHFGKPRKQSVRAVERGEARELGATQ